MLVKDNHVGVVLELYKHSALEIGGFLLGYRGNKGWSLLGEDCVISCELVLSGQYPIKRLFGLCPLLLVL